MAEAASAAAAAAALEDDEAIEVQTVEEENEAVDPATLKADPQFAELSPMEKAYQRVLTGVRTMGDIAPEDDPEHPDFIDPLDREDVCEICRKPETPTVDLMQCFTDYGDIGCCCKWFHAPCVNRDKPPQDDWLCKDCVLSSTGQEVGMEGFELIQPEDKDEEEVENNDDKEEEEEEEDLNTKPKAKQNGSDTEYEGFSDEEEEEDLNTKPKAKRNSGDSEYERFSDSDEDSEEDSIKPTSTKRRKVNNVPARKKKGKAVPVDLLDDVSDDDNDIQISQKTWVARAAGVRPQTARQQQDSRVRAKLKTIKKGMETLQRQSLPYTRSDEYNPDDSADDELAMNQSHWPWVNHGACCFTNQAPNGDGTSEAKFLAKPELHMWFGSHASAEWVAGQFKGKMKGLGFRIKVHTNFDSYQDAFRSDSAKNKTAPPRPTKSTVKID